MWRDTSNRKIQHVAEPAAEYGAINDSEPDVDMKSELSQTTITIPETISGEPPHSLHYISQLLMNNDIRRMIYIVLMCIWLLPLTVDSFDVVVHTNLHKTSFCVDYTTCRISLVGFSLLSVATYVQFYLIGFGKIGHQKSRTVLYFMQCSGMLCVLAVMIFVTFDIYDTAQPYTTCFKLDHTNHAFCRVSYLGNNCLGLVLLVMLHLDIWFKQQQFMIRVICAAVGLVTSAGCITVNLFVNKTYYANQPDGIPFTISSYCVCAIGYSLIIVSLTICLPYLLLTCLHIEPKHKRQISKVCGFLLLLGLFCIQVRTFTMHWMFTLLGMILIVDIQVLGAER